jgi:uncharacterized membrane protein
MTHFFELLISTIAYRPYVFIFFACYLFLAITHIGWRRAALFTAIAYGVAFVCEWSSAVAATGFPFGLYYYIDRTSHRELWIAGVPFMDSLSFTFLSYVSWEMATVLLGRLKTSWRDVQVMNGSETRNRWVTAALAAFLMMYLDIIIDPLALRGDRWFLGKIYYYPDGGSYFGITLANFLGWFFVCFVIIRLFVALESVIFTNASKSKRAPMGRQEPRILTDATNQRGLAYRYKALGPVGLYFGVIGFNLFMTFWIGERELGVVGVIVVLPLIVMITLALGRAEPT